MKMTCRKCKKPYFFDEAKMPEEGIIFKCPRCGNNLVFKKDSASDDLSVPKGSGTNPLVYGSYAGALGGLGCAVPVLMTTLLGIGIMSLGVQVSGYTAAAALVLVLLKMLSFGILIGMSLSYVGARTEIDVWSVKGGLIGALIGVIIGLAGGLFVATFMGGILGLAVIFGSVLGGLIKAALVSAVVILVRRFVFPDEKGSLSAALSGRQTAFVGVLFFVMVFTIGMDVKGLYQAKFAYNESAKQMSSEGLIIKEQDRSSNERGTSL